MSAFEYELEGIQGVRLVAAKEGLHPLCKSDAEIDYYINELKDQLDQVATKMKQALKREEDQSLGLDTSN